MRTDTVRWSLLQIFVPPNDFLLANFDTTAATGRTGKGNRVSVRRAQRSPFDGTVKARPVPWEDDAMAAAAPPDRSGLKMALRAEPPRATPRPEQEVCLEVHPSCSV
ncbi:hypothetical protein MRX96_028551 [Rhipicephalus microplus]